MPVAVHCPTCGQELVAPEELIGQIAACPGCNAQFPIQDSGNRQQSATPPPPPSTNKPNATDQRSVSASDPPVNAQRPANAQPPAKTLPSADAYFPPGRGPAPKPPAEPELPTPRPSQPKQRVPETATTPRAAQPAKFIAGESTETAIELGQDGQLPMLVLADTKGSETADADGQKSNPLILVGVLCFSLLASLSMLLIDPTTVRSEPDSKESARAQIEANYVKGNPLREPYQELLAAALQAHHKGDYSEERANYRQVLKMLREENKNAYTGVTGRVSAPMPPSDEHLDSLLRSLLR